MKTTITDIQNAFIDKDTLRDNNEIVLIKVRAFVLICLLWIVSVLMFVFININQGHYEPVIPLLVTGSSVILLLYLLRKGMNKHFIYGVFMALICIHMLMIIYKTSDYVRILPWWGTLVMVYGVLTEKVKNTAIWVLILYAGAMISLSFSPDTVIHNGPQSITLVFLCTFAVQHYYTKRKDILINKLDVALSEIKTLRGMLPICSTCKKIRDDQGVWNRIESYISERSEAEFTHSNCPDCIRELYPEMAEEILAEMNSQSS